MMSPSMTNDELAVLDVAFRMVCAELGLTANTQDSKRRDHLAKTVVSIANGGERDPTAIARRAYMLMRAYELAM